MVRNQRVQLLAWLTLRTLMFGFFGYYVWRDWSGMTPAMNVIGITVGPLLVVFNTVALSLVILPGCPWTPKGKLGGKTAPD